MFTPRKCAIIGTGGIAGTHLKAIRANSPRAELVAIADIDPSRIQAFMQKHELASRSFTSPDEMLRETEPDLVHVCTPPGAHAELSIAAMEAGAHVLCEKPLCASLEELDRIQETESRTGRTCSSVFQYRFGSGTVHLQNLMREGILGRPLVGVCNTLWYRPQAYYEVPWRGKWATELGGPTMGHGVHAMAQLLSILGPWAEIQASAATIEREIEVEDVSMVMARFQSDALVSIVNSILSPRQETYLRLDFTKATVELTHLYSYENKHWRFTPVSGAEHLTERWNQFPHALPSTHAVQLGCLLDDLDGGRVHSTSGASAREMIEFLSAIYKSAFTRQPVRAGSITKKDPFYRSLHGGQGGSPLRN